MYEKFRHAIETAARLDQKMATFHFVVLSNADELGAADADDFCRDVGVPASYSVEFRKMLGLARVMREQGVRLTQS